MTRITIAGDGVVVGESRFRWGSTRSRYIAHELEHILERAEGVDLPGQSARKDSGVWMALDGYETQRAIDRGRQVVREVRESPRAARCVLVHFVTQGSSQFFVAIGPLHAQAPVVDYWWIEGVIRRTALVVVVSGLARRSRIVV